MNTVPENEPASPDTTLHAFRRVEHWIFDLDNTLYPADCHLFSQIDARMASFIEERLSVPSDQARKIQKEYYVRYGTTLNGLMTEHRLPPSDFLDYVHDIDVSVVTPNQALRDHIEALPGDRFIFTNGTVAHAERVLGRLGLADLFNDIVDIEASAYTPKPHRSAYELFLDRTNSEPNASAMFEDISHNLTEPHALGMTTVLVASDAEWMNDEPADKRPARAKDTLSGKLDPHIHHVTDDLSAFLGRIRTTLGSTDAK